MNTTLKTLISCLAILLLAGCFPGNRMYVSEECDREVCTPLPNGAEFTFVKQPNGSKYEVWVNQKPELANGPKLILDCEGTIKNDKFECTLCGGDFEIAKAKGADCSFAKCVAIDWKSSPDCPDGGTGKGGHN